MDSRFKVYEFASDTENNNKVSHKMFFLIIKKDQHIRILNHLKLITFYVFAFITFKSFNFLKFIRENFKKFFNVKTDKLLQL